MRNSITSLVAGASLLASALPALADQTCTLSTTRGDTVSYSFRGVQWNGRWPILYTETAFYKNGQPYNGHGAIWRTRMQGDYFFIAPEGSPEYVLVLGPYPVQTQGRAPVRLLRGLQVVGWGECVATQTAAKAAPPVYTPPPVYAGPPAPPPPGYKPKDSVPIFYPDRGTAALIDIYVGSQPIRMLIDTGASMMSVPEHVAERLLLMGEAEDAGWDDFKIADGSVVRQRVITIRRITIGSHVLYDIKASVSNGSPLLPFPVLNMVGRFTIDTAARELLFG